MNNTTYEDEEVRQTQRCLYLTIKILTHIFGTVGNVLVLVVVIRRHRKNNANHFFIANLAVSDLTFIFFYLSFTTYTSIFGEPEIIEIYYLFCHFIFPLYSLTFTVGIMTLTSLAMYRCYFIVHPFKAQPKHRTIWLIIAGVWIYSIFLQSPFMIFMRTKENKFCRHVWSENAKRVYYLTLFFLQLVVPFFIITIAYTIIARDLLSSKTRRACIDEKGRVATDRACKENKQVIRAFIVVVLLFIICLFPLQVLQLIIQTFVNVGDDKAMYPFFDIAQLLSILHACINPIVYGTFTQQFRQGYIKCVLFFLRRRSCACALAKKFPSMRKEEGRNHRHDKGNQEVSLLELDHS